MNEYDVLYNAKMSFIYYFKEVFLKKVGYFYSKNKSILSVTKNKKYDIEENIIHSDEYGNPKNGLKIYFDKTLVPEESYSFNYIENKVKFLESYKNITIEYKIPAIDIIDAYPDIESNTFEKPIMSFEIEDFTSSPFEIGSRKRYWSGNLFIDCFCTNDTMRERLRGAITFELANQNIPLVDFLNNSLINGDGSLNEDFVYFPCKHEIYDLKRISAENYDMSSLNKKKCSVCSISTNFTLIF